MSSKNTVPSKSLILGASRGLGRSIFELLPDSLGASRTSQVQIDLAKSEASGLVSDLIEKENIEIIFYVAGGGPHGDFFEKSFKSHAWAYQVNYFTPIQIAYDLIAKKYQGKFVYIGSAIAERSNSSKGLSYSQSKKMALKTLLSLPEKDLKTYVFSPPYMDTDLLPKGAWPRRYSNLVVDPKKVAEVMLNWLQIDLAPFGNSDVRHFDWLKEFEYSIPKDKEF